MSRTDTTVDGKIFIQSLEVRCIIGTLPRERRKKQKIVIDLEFPANIKKAARQDRLKDALNYQTIAKKIRTVVSDSRFYLIETLAEKLAAFLLKEYPISSLTLKITKPGAIQNAQSVGVSIHRKKKS